MRRKIGVAEAEAEFGCHVAELRERGDLYGAERHGCGSSRCQQVVARSILIDHLRLATHVSAQKAFTQGGCVTPPGNGLWKTSDPLTR
jgi:hypothetical protein